MSKLKKVIIAGRTNVGKSTLFNRLSSEVKSLTLDFSGVTRDFIKDTVNWKNSTFELIDSGGLVLKKQHSEIEKKIQELANSLIKEADLILFVCDGKTGIVQEDLQISKILHKSNKKVILVINKIDTKLAKEQEYEFHQLGFTHTISISAQHGINISDLLDEIVNNIGQTNKIEQDEAKYKVVFLGKPNVGKSSLMNLLLEQERAIVTAQPGTTREAISEKIRFYKESIIVTDTPGVRKKRSVNEEIESMMVKSTLSAVRNSDIVLMLIDISEGKISDQELKLAFYVFEKGKNLILLFNKEDLLTEKIKKELEFSLKPYNYFLKKIETLNISCKTGKNIGKILPLVDKVWRNSSIKFSDIELTDIFKKALEKTPHYHKTIPLIINNAKQLKSFPITILLTVNEPRWFGKSQLAFLENTLRNKFGLKSSPIIFSTKKS